jgi:quinone-modifying oxidoreductase subunit QmoB
MDTKVGVYICSGCGIGEALDIEDLKGVAGKAQAAVVKDHACLCCPEAVQQIRADLASEQLNRLVIAACSGRVMTDVFDFGPELLVDRTSLREQVAWCQDTSTEVAKEDTQMLAQDYIRMGMARVKNSEAPVPEIPDISKTVLVVGGGVAGLTSAKAAAQAGYDVVLVEKEAQLGGWSHKFTLSFPRKQPWTDLEQGGLADLIAEVQGNPKITIHKSTTVKKIVGAPGLFDVTLAGNGSSELRVGSIVQASGWRPYEPRMLAGKWGYGSSPDIVTNVQLEEMFSNGGIKRPTTGKAPASVAFIQCAGSRDPDHLPYCSAVCCRTSLKQAVMIREQFPDTQVYILYREMRTPGQFELFYKKVQEDEGIFLTKGEVYEVKPNGGQIAIKVEDTLLGQNIEVQADLVVLAAGMVPTTKVDVGILDKDEAAGEAASENAVADGKAETARGVNEGAGSNTVNNPVATGSEATAQTVEAEKAEKIDQAAGAEAGARILNLVYRQGTDLPTLKYGFPDSHFICFPYETRRTAIYAAGCVRAPMDTMQARKDAHGAALKAIQAVELIGRGMAVHPRARDTSFPDFFLQRCTQCKRCTEECPFGTLNEDAKGTPLPNPTRCRRCGICLGSCPERIISFKNYSPNMISQMIKSIEIPDEEDEKPRYLAFICENDALPVLDMAATKRLKISPYLRFIPVRCLGAVNVVWIGDALSSGFDGILLLGCKYGDDYQCHYVKGSELATTRMDNVKDKLEQLALEEERVQIHTLAINEWEKLPRLIDAFAEEMAEVGMNPFKGF